MREVVFDIGNVLLRWDPRNLYRKVFDDTATMEAFLAEALPGSFIVTTDVAESFADTLAARMRALPHHAERIALFDARWMETLDGPIAENVALLRKLKASGARVHALSNFAREKFALSLASYEFLGLFDVAVVSGHEGVAKPDRRIYEILVERTRKAPGELLFVDDSLKNIHAARDFGIEAIHFTPELDLNAEFARRGVVV